MKKIILKKKKTNVIDILELMGITADKTEVDEVLEAINDEEKYVIVGTAPSIRVSLGEEFGNPFGTIVKGKMVNALKKLGFDQVFDLDFGADLTIMEEANEFVERISLKEKLPMFTSCCPGWVKFVEQNYPTMIDNLSTCKSPQQMFGAALKTYYAKKNNIDPKNIFVVTVMPCIIKKFEKEREYQSASSYKDVDAVITTRELADLIKVNNIDFNKLKDEEFDNPFGLGASVIFGATGGVMESALKTVYETMTNKTYKKLEFKEVRGSKGIREATYIINNKKIKVAVVCGLNNAKIIMDQIAKGKKTYHFVEVMVCPFGCVSGAGQPKIKNINDTKKVYEQRRKALYKELVSLPVKKAHDNIFIKNVYEEYLEKPGSKKAHEILHTKYIKKV